MTTVTILSNDGKAFTVDVKIAEKSSIIKDMLENTMLQAGEPVIMSTINGKTMAKVFEWAEYHRDDPPEEENVANKQKMSSELTPWEAQFFKIDHRLLLDLFNAADFLDIKGLFQSCCKIMAIMIGGKTPQEVKEIINFSNKSEE